VQKKGEVNFALRFSGFQKEVHGEENPRKEISDRGAI
jgi:hypothetical protein